MKNNNGGPAFPRPCSEDRTQGDQPDGNRTVAAEDGMTLRDYFAAAAMTGLARTYATGEVNDYLPPFVAEDAYKLADAMLAARDKKATGAP